MINLKSDSAKDSKQKLCLHKTSDFSTSSLFSFLLFCDSCAGSEVYTERFLRVLTSPLKMFIFSIDFAADLLFSLKTVQKRAYPAIANPKNVNFFELQEFFFSDSSMLLKANKLIFCDQRAVARLRVKNMELLFKKVWFEVISVNFREIWDLCRKFWYSILSGCAIA